MAYYLFIIPGQMPDALSGKEESWYKLIRQDMEEWYQEEGISLTAFFFTTWLVIH
jgi:hypothetical protein